MLIKLLESSEYLGLLCKDRITGRTLHGTKPGSKPYLSKAKENELANFLRPKQRLAMVKTRKKEMNTVESTVKEKGLLRKYRISDGWFRHFTKRQPQLSLRIRRFLYHLKECFN